MTQSVVPQTIMSFTCQIRGDSRHFFLRELPHLHESDDKVDDVGTDGEMVAEDKGASEQDGDDSVPRKRRAAAAYRLTYKRVLGGSTVLSSSSSFKIILLMPAASAEPPPSLLQRESYVVIFVSTPTRWRSARIDLGGLQPAFLLP